MDVKTGFFYVFSLVLLFAAFRVITARNPVHAVLYLMLAFTQASAIWLLLQAEFLAITLVLVYLGAVMVLFLFVVMLVGVDASDSVVETIKGQRLLAIVFGLILGVVLVTGLSQITLGTVVGLDDANSAGGGNGQARATNLGPDTEIGTWPEFNKMIGGFFKFHWNDGQSITVKIDEPKHPQLDPSRGEGPRVLRSARP